MTKQILTIAILGIMLLVSPAPFAAAQTQCVTPTVSTAVYDWLTQQVCVNSNNQPLSVDPCSCPSGDSLRRLLDTDKMPYHKWDQAQTVRHDSFITKDTSGKYWTVNTEGQATTPGLNGYTVYRSDNLYALGWTFLRSGTYWASSDGTKDGANFNASLWGCDASGAQGCQSFGGWLFFPSSALTDMSNSEYDDAEFQNYMFSRHWEQDQAWYPGVAPTATTHPYIHYTATGNLAQSASTNPQSPTQYTSASSLTYGPPTRGTGAAAPCSTCNGTQKTITNNVVEVHGYDGSANWGNAGHLEVEYFTQMYGWTRWESWRPINTYQWTSGNIAKAETAASKCYPAQGTYQQNLTYNSLSGNVVTTTFYGVPNSADNGEFFMAACADYTYVTTGDADSTPPAWPIPEMNLLGNPNFTTSGGSGPSTSGWNTSDSPQFNAVTSSLTADTQYCDTSGTCGVDYATLQGADVGGTYECNGSTSGTCEIYYDFSLPSGLTAGNAYWFDYGSFAAIDASSPVTSNVQFTITLYQLDSNGNPITTAGEYSTYTATLNNHVSTSEVLNSVLAGPYATDTDSSNNTIYVTQPQSITIDSNAQQLQVAITFQPQSGAIIDIPEVWAESVP